MKAKAKCIVNEDTVLKPPRCAAVSCNVSRQDTGGMWGQRSRDTDCSRERGSRSSPPSLSPIFKALSANVTRLDEGEVIELFLAPCFPPSPLEISPSHASASSPASNAPLGPEAEIANFLSSVFEGKCPSWRPDAVAVVMTLETRWLRSAESAFHLFGNKRSISH
ncbi:putative defensin-like protein 31 [Dissostichus eleginoides]|uniref:Defensin-like protein 31 n=1 Tax=Dissostichus eleginoides TaxID=100907 RepID=A0AAD9EY39_DISEL|nr:putative defensin-like protein 31 [Dissostichus eleginoides]